MPDKTPATRVWDPLVRIFHWGLVLTFTAAYLSGDDWMSLHSSAGHLVVVLIGIRIIWGLLGTRYARFSSFIYKPSTILAYIRDILSTRAARHLGHNPAGGAMVIALLICILVTSVSGLMIDETGPLKDYAMTLGHEVRDNMEELHEWSASFSLVLIFLHIAGVYLASVQHRENLVLSMLTGLKRSKE